MSTLTLPRAQIPLTVGGDRMSPEFYRWAYDVTIRAGGVTGEGTDELSAAMFEDAGIEELKMQVYQLTDELRSFPPNIHWPDPEVDSQQARIEALEAQVAELTKIIDSILAGPSLQGTDMASSPRPLWTAQAAPTAQTTMFTSDGLKTIIDKLTVSNPTAGVLTYAINLVPSGGTAGASNLILTKSLAAGEVYTFPEIVGHVLESGGFISVIASSASLIHRASGRFGVT